MIAAAMWPAERAYAYDGQVTVGLGAGPAFRFADSEPKYGANLELNASLGLSDIWTIRGFLSYSIHPDNKPLHGFFTGLEILYLLDVLEFVPYFGVGIDGVGSLRSNRLTIDAAAHAVLGIDYLFSREFFLGLAIRPFVFVSALDTQPGYLTAILTLNMIFDL